MRQFNVGQETRPSGCKRVFGLLQVLAVAPDDCIVLYRAEFRRTTGHPVAAERDVSDLLEDIDSQVANHLDHVDLLVPGGSVTVDENGVVWKIVPVLDEICQVSHGFAAFVRRHSKVNTWDFICDDIREQFMTRMC